MENIVECQAMIWSTGTPLKEQDWKSAGFADLKAYIDSTLDVSLTHLKLEEKQAIERMPYCSFGLFNLKTGDKDQALVCRTANDLPTEDIEGVLTFDPPQDGAN